MDEYERLREVEGITTLVARRVRALDTKDWDTYAALHAEDHVSYGFGGEPSVGRESMMARLIEFTSGLTTVHMVHSPSISFTSPTDATGSWMLEDRLFWTDGGVEHWFVGYGYYDDTYRKEHSEWVFTSRRLMRLRTEHSPGATRTIF